MGRSPRRVNVGLRKGTWTAEEDQKLVSFIEQHGHGSWCSLPAKAGLQRCGKSCRLRWTNYLRSDIKRGKFSLEEEKSIIQLHALLGNKWSTIASYLPQRTDNDIKNHWNTCLKKRLNNMGIDPSTHKPKVSPLGGFGQFKDTANLNHMAQWESARLEAESRLAVKSTLFNSVVSTSKYFSGSAITSYYLGSTSLGDPNFCDLPPSLRGCQLGGTWRSINPGGTLPSPTSILNFSDNALRQPLWNPTISNLHLAAATAVSTTSCMAATLAGDNNAAAPFSSALMITKATANDLDSTINDDDIIADLSACFEEPLVEQPPSFLEGFDDVPNFDNPFGHGSCSDTGNLEDNRRYWNSIVDEEN